jgi:hypothetical protein
MPIFSSLDSVLWWWEFGEYTSEAIVILGCAGEFIAEFTDRLTSGDEAKKRSLSKLSLLILIAGLATGLACLMGATVTSGRIIGSLNEEAGQARLDAGHADERASKAEKEAADARERAAALELQAAKLEERMLELGPRDLLLYGKREEALMDGLRRFKGQKVQIRICVVFNNEVRDTAERLTTILELAKWRVAPNSPNWGESNCLINDPTGAGIWLGTPSTTPDTITQGRAIKLLGFLQAIPLLATLHKVEPITARAESGKTIEERYDDPDSIVIVVLSHSFERTNPPSRTGGGFFF